MPYRICKTMEVESGHLLSKHPGLCRFPHGHTRRIEVTLEAPSLDPMEMVCDFKKLHALLDECASKWDHAFCMNTADPNFAALKKAYGNRILGFDQIDPTTEVLAKTLHDELKEKMKSEQWPLAIRLANVRVWETSTAWAEYSEP